jgi:hypothetical protein
VEETGVKVLGIRKGIKIGKVWWKEGNIGC